MADDQLEQALRYAIGRAYAAGKAHKTTTDTLGGILDDTMRQLPVPTVEALDDVTDRICAGLSENGTKLGRDDRALIFNTIAQWKKLR